jgi:hypothetical protein
MAHPVQVENGGRTSTQAPTCCHQVVARSRSRAESDTGSGISCVRKCALTLRGKTGACRASRYAKKAQVHQVCSSSGLSMSSFVRRRGQTAHVSGKGRGTIPTSNSIFDFKSVLHLLHLRVYVYWLYPCCIVTPALYSIGTSSGPDSRVPPSKAAVVGAHTDFIHIAASHNRNAASRRRHRCHRGQHPPEVADRRRARALLEPLTCTRIDTLPFFGYSFTFSFLYLLHFISLLC